MDIMIIMTLQVITIDISKFIVVCNFMVPRRKNIFSVDLYQKSLTTYLPLLYIVYDPLNSTLQILHITLLHITVL